MYSVSDKYKANMKAPIQRFGLDGTIGAVHFDESNVLQGTFNIENQCMSDTSITLGGVNIGVLSATFVGVNINRYAWKGQVITPRHTRLFDDSTSESVPLGKYTIAEAYWSRDGVSITAYDNMSKFDKDFVADGTTGTPFSLLTAWCTACEVSMGMTNDEVRALPNGQEAYVLHADNDIQTYRDAISYLAAAMGCWAQIDRAGRLIFKTFSHDPVDTIQPNERFQGITLEDFQTRYTAVHVTKGTDVYRVHEIQDNGLDMDLGANPFMQYGDPTRRLQNILDALQSIYYTPFTCDMIGDPAYDLGDVILFERGLADGSPSCIQRFTYIYNGTYQCAGVGDKPTTMSKEEKELAAMAAGQVQNEIQYYIFKSNNQIVIEDTKTKDIINLRFTSLKATKVIFHAEVLLTAHHISDAATCGVVSYLWNGSEITAYNPTETWIDGKHVLHLLYHLELGEAEMHRWLVRMTADGGDIIVKGIESSISGQGLLATDSWDGYIEAEDSITLAQLNVEPVVVPLHRDSATLTLQDRILIEVTDGVDDADLEIEPEEITDYTDAVYLNKGRLKDLTWGTVSTYKWTAEGVQNPITEDEYAW